MQQTIIALVGDMASGKGLCAEYIIKQCNASSYRFSNILRDIIVRLHMPSSRDALITLSELLRNYFGENVLAHAMTYDVKHDTTSVIVIDGVRRLADIEHLNQLKGFVLVHITADARVRYNRLKNRGEKTDEYNLTFEEFEKNHQRSTEQSIHEVSKYANYTITNNEGVQELYTQLDQLITTLHIDEYGSAHQNL